MLARGISYALSLEATLKLQETCYYKMKGYAYSDFQHGPMAMVGQGTPILFFAPRIGFVDKAKEDAHTAEVKAMIDKMKSFGAKVVILTDGGDYGEYDNVFALNRSESEVTGMFSLTMLAQLLACKLSAAIGNNPDSPRALNKVTITK